MEKVLYQVTEEDVREEVCRVLEEYEEDGLTKYPDETARESVIQEAVETVVNGYESYDNYYSMYTGGSYNPNYEDIVYDALRDCDCLNEDE